MPNIAETEPNNTAALANQVQIGDTITGALSASTDADYFKFTVDQTSVVHFQLNPGKIYASGYAYSFYVYDSKSLVVAGGVAGAGSAVDINTVLKPGSYSVGVVNGGNWTPDPYTLLLSYGSGSPSSYESEPNDTIANASSVTLGVPTTGQLRSFVDKDTYKVSTTSAGALTINVSNPLLGAFGPYELLVMAPDGKTVDHQFGVGNTTTLENILPAGDYYIQLQGSTTSDYTLTVNQASQTAQTPVLTPTAPVPGSLDGAGAVQLYTVNVTAGQAYDFYLSGVTGGGGTLTAPTLGIYSPDGKLLESRTSQTLRVGADAQLTDPHLSFVAPMTGSLTLAVSTAGKGGSYTLSETTHALTDLAAATQYIANAGFPNAYFKTVPGQTLTLSFAFMSSLPVADSFLDGFKGMNDLQKTAVRQSLQTYEKFLNVHFVEATDPGSANILFGTADAGTGAGGFTINGAKAADGTYQQMDVYLNNNSYVASGVSTAAGLAVGGYGFFAILHEIGHALGLKHSGNYEVTSGSGTPPYLPSAFDNQQYSLMSYNLDPEVIAAYASTPMVLDLIALQGMYGQAVHPVGTLSFSVPNNAATISSAPVGQVGDAIDASNQTLGAVISLQAGTLSAIGPGAYAVGGFLVYPSANNIWVPLGSSYTVAKGGSGNDVIFGNDLDNVLSGGAGNDTLYGLGGGDTVDGGAGADTARYAGRKGDYNLSANTAAGTFSVADKTTARDGSDVLSTVERLQFADGSLAIDLGVNQAAGKAVLMLGAVLGPAGLGSPSLLGSFIHYFDSGASLQDGATLLVASGIMGALVGGSDNASFVSYVFGHAGAALPDAATVAGAVASLNSGGFTQAQLLAAAALSTQNQEHVVLVGLQQTGVVFS